LTLTIDCLASLLAKIRRKSENRKSINSFFRLSDVMMFPIGEYMFPRQRENDFVNIFTFFRNIAYPVFRLIAVLLPPIQSYNTYKY
jgi:hypothetical protein